MPDFKFRNVRFLIDTPDQAFAEYSVEAQMPATGRIYPQMYAGRLVARDGKIQRFRESMDTLAAAKAFAPARSLIPPTTYIRRTENEEDHYSSVRKHPRPDRWQSICRCE